MQTPLAQLTVLALDCQATAPNPAKGHLLEVGWSKATATHGASLISAQLLQLPEDVTIPKRVQRVTGITEDALEQASSPERIWSDLERVAADVARSNDRRRCPTVIHFSRFEEPYLYWLQRSCHADSLFPFEILCTHEIAKRLLPHLPRRGLRAVAGYFGVALPELHRSASHVEATVSIWQAAIVLLRERASVETLEDLQRWLSLPASRPTRDRERRYPMPERARRGLPDRPGVYRMLRSDGSVLYVGKATSLRKRVASYFRARAPHSEHILEMLSQAHDLELTVTGSALEASLLEADVIKALEPPYNRALRSRERVLLYGNATLTRFSDVPDRFHTRGPLPGRDLWLAFAELQRLMVHDSGPQTLSPAELLNVPEGFAPSDEVLRAGLALFQQRNRLSHRGLLALGSELWLATLAAKQEKPHPPDELELAVEVDLDAARDWSAGGVANRLEELVLRASHMVRRARWLHSLGSSVVTWTPRGETAPRSLVFRSGRPTAYSGRASEQDRLDLTDVDRLVVLTKELRRLLSEGREVSVRLATGAVVDGGRLGRFLRWI